MSRSYDRDRDQLKNFEARLNRTEYSRRPTPNHRNQRHESSDFSPVRHKGAGPDASRGDCSKHFFSTKDEAKAAFIESLGSLAAHGGFQIVHGRTRNMHFMPHWTPVHAFSGARILWLPERSDWVTPKERQLAKIAVLIEAGHDANKIARKLGIPLRTIERRIAYLLSVQPDADKNGGKARETGAFMEGGANLATPATQLRNAKEKTMPKSKITPFDPISIEVTVRQRPDGRIVVGYAGDDDRTPAIGEFVLDITAALDAI
jgi:hypothetical protein